MDSSYITNENRILFFDDILRDLSNFVYRPSEEIKYLIKNPSDVYRNEILPQRIKDQYKLQRIQTILDKVNNRNDTTFSDTEIKNRVEEILERYRQNKSFNFIKQKDIKCLFRYDVLWLSNDYKQYKEDFIRYLQNESKFYGVFRQILQLYIRLYSKLKNDNEYKELYSKAKDKYIAGKKFILKNIENIFNDCDLLNNNAVNRIADICIYNKQVTNKPITNIINDRYKYIKPHTNLFDEIVVRICSICRNNINEDFYFDLLFEEVLSADIDSKTSGKIVSEVITLFGKDENVPQKDLEKIKLALLHNPNYGDPRIRKLVKNYWDDVDSEAKHIFITWLARADLEFFFNVAFKGVYDPHNRKAFWQKYINSRQLVESNVILSKTHYDMPEVREEAERNGVTFKRFENQYECSCFILKFNNIYIVEFSEVNNALYFYNDGYFDKSEKLQGYLYKIEDFKTRGAKVFSENGQYNDVNELYKEKSFMVRHYIGWENLVEKVFNAYGIYKG